MQWMCGRRNAAVIVCGCLLVFLLPTPAMAQSSQARISGRVTDPTGAVVPAVQVTARNTETGVETRTQTNESGIYTLPYLSPGQYSLIAAAEGFKKNDRVGIRVETAEVREINIQLELGAVSEVTTVTAQQPLLENASGTVGQYMSNELLTDMPLAGRNSLDLVGMVGAAVPLGQNTNGKALFSLAGGRVLNQSFSLDGGNVQNTRLGIGQNAYDPPVESLQEFRVVQNGYSAEFGGSAGGVVISTSKTGTNEFHGSAWEFFRNDKLDAANFFAPRDALTHQTQKPTLRYNLYGATLGGPIRRNRTFFFGTYRRLTNNAGSPVTLNVPSLLQRQGDFSRTYDSAGRLTLVYDPATTRPSGNTSVRDLFPGNVIPTARFDAVASRLAQYWPSPNATPVNLAGASNFVANQISQSPAQDFIGRLDHSFSDQDRLFVRYIHTNHPVNTVSAYPNPVADPTNVFRAKRPEYYLNASLTHNFTPTLIVDVRYAYNARTNIPEGAGIGSNVVKDVGLKGVPDSGFPQLTVAGMSAIGLSRYVYNVPIRDQQISGSFTWSRGSHLLKFGGEIRPTYSYIVNSPQISGAFSFNANGTALPGNSLTGLGFASFLVGYGASFTMANSDPLQRSLTYLAGFFQDDWKVSRSLTLNLGLRWETDTPMRDSKNAMNGFDPTAINPVSKTPGVVRFAGVNGWPETAYDANWKNFGPRAGFAWRPRQTDRWVVRGGFAVSFEHPFDADVSSQAALGFQQAATLNSPNNVTPAFSLAAGIPSLNLSPVRDDSFGAVAVGGTASTAVTFFERNRHTGYAMQYSLGIQRQLTPSTLVEVTYMASLARHFPNSNLSLNQIPPALMGPGSNQTRRPFPQFSGVSTIVPSNGSSNYHAGMARVERRLSRGWSLLTSYTWSRSIGDLSENSGLGDNQNRQDFYNRHADKGPSTIDVPQRLAFSSTLALPFGKSGRWCRSDAGSLLLSGWTLAGIFTAMSGGPFTVTMQTDTTGAFSAGALRANVLRDGNLPSGQQSLLRWFDTSAFQAPASYTYGNAGRGILRGPSTLGLNTSLSRTFSLAERIRVQVRGEALSLLNHPNFRIPGDSMGLATFGIISSASGSRVIQLGVRLTF